MKQSSTMEYMIKYIQIVKHLSNSVYDSGFENMKASSKKLSSLATFRDRVIIKKKYSTKAKF